MKTFEELQRDGILKAHNIETYQKVQELFENGKNRVGVVQATGTGKSYIALQFLYDNVLTKKNKHALILDPLHGIVDQFRGLFEEEYFKKNIPLENMGVTFAHYVGLSTLTDEEIKLLDFDYIVLDEFHGLGAEQRGENVKKLLAANPDAKVLGLTATPVRYLDNHRDMGDEIFGDSVVRGITLKEAIEESVLPEPDYVMAVYSYADTIKEIEDKIKRVKNKKSRDLYEKDLALAKQNAETAEGLCELFARKIEKKNGKFIAFCSNFERLDSLKGEIQAGLFNGVNKKVKMYSVTCRDGKAKANKTIKEFENDNSDELKILLAVKMLDEGIHVKNVDGCFMFRPTISPRIYLQQLGRVLSVRQEENFKPLVFDVVNNIQCLDTISAAFEFEIDRKAYGYQIFDGEGNYIPFKIDGNDIALNSLLLKLDAEVTNTLTTKEEWLAAAERYKNEFGNLDVPQRYKEEKTELNLGGWLSNVRQGIRKNNISRDADYILQLLELDPKVFDYAKNTSEEMRVETLFMLKEFTEKEGKVAVSEKFMQQYKILYNRIGTIKRALTDGKVDEEKKKKTGHTYINQDLIDQINEINPNVLNKRISPEEMRAELLAMVKEFTKKEGKVPVTEKFKEYKTLYGRISIVKRALEDGNIDEEKLKKSQSAYINQDLIDQINEINPNALKKKQMLSPEEMRAETLAMIKEFTEKEGQVFVLKNRYKTLHGRIERIKSVLTHGKIDEKKMKKFKCGTYINQDLVDQINQINPNALKEQMSPEVIRAEILEMLRGFTEREGVVAVPKRRKEYQTLYGRIAAAKSVLTDGNIDEEKLKKSGCTYVNQNLIDQINQINPNALIKKGEPCIEIKNGYQNISDEARLKLEQRDAKILEELKFSTEKYGQTFFIQDDYEFGWLKLQIDNVRSVLTEGKLDKEKMSKKQMLFSDKLISNINDINPKLLLSMEEKIKIRAEQNENKISSQENDFVPKH